MGRHAFSPEGICCTCRIVTDAYTAPHSVKGVSVQSPLLGSPVGTMDPPRIPKLDPAAPMGPPDPTIFRRTMAIVRHSPPRGDSQ